MVNSMRLTTLPSDYEGIKEGSSQWSHRVKALLVVCSHRMWRGGPRSMLQIAVIALTLIIMFYIVPLRFGDSYQKLTTWSAPQPTITNDVRIVVFGSQDVLGSAPDANHARTTWPEQLCKQLHCSSVHSLIPPIDSHPGLISNEIYRKELDAMNQLTELANITAQPASDYVFIREQYPVPQDTPDLEAQVKKFLAMPPSQIIARETLWVFTFGTWEVWNLAAMPRQTGENLIAASVAQLFSQIELLYRKSLNPKSIAFSDFWSNATKEEIKLLTAPGANGKLDERRVESFRVVIPQLLDISLTPGWQNRPLPSMPQSRGVQLRNAAFLTQKWNEEVSKRLHDWRRLGISKPEGIEEEDVDIAIEIPKVDSLLQYLPEVIRPNQKQSLNSTADEDIVYAPFPRRAGLQSYLAVSVVEAMTEEEMRRSGLKDGRGRGTMSDHGAMRFFDVWNPCVAGSRSIVGIETPATSDVCDVPNNHLFYDRFTLAERAIEQLAKKAADAVKEQLFLS